MLQVVSSNLTSEQHFGCKTCKVLIVMLQFLISVRATRPLVSLLKSTSRIDLVLKKSLKAVGIMLEVG